MKIKPVVNYNIQPKKFENKPITVSTLIPPKKTVTLVEDPNKVYDVPDRDNWFKKPRPLKYRHQIQRSMVGISSGNELMNKSKPENQSHNLIDAFNRMHQNLKEEKIFDESKYMKNVSEENSNN